MRDTKIGEVSDAIIKINFHYGEGDTGTNVPIVRNIFVKNVQSQKSKYALFIQGYAHSPINTIHIENCQFNNVAAANRIENCNDLDLTNVFINNELYEYVK
jgi:hypothetical protein